MATINKLHGGADIFNLFIVKKLLSGVHRIRYSVDTRLPIQLNLLHALVESIPHVVPTPYMQALLKASYLVCFHAFLRVGEIAAKTSSDRPTIEKPHCSYLVHASAAKASYLVCFHAFFRVWEIGAKTASDKTYHSPIAASGRCFATPINPSRCLISNYTTSIQKLDI